MSLWIGEALIEGLLPMYKLMPLFFSPKIRLIKIQERGERIIGSITYCLYTILKGGFIYG